MARVVKKSDFTIVESAYLPDYPTADWIHNPDLSPLSGVPTKYWKVVSDQILEMTQAEKDAADLTLEYLDKYGYNGKDYKYVRQKIIDGVTSAGGFSNLTTAEKEIATRWFAVAKSDRDTVYTTEQQILLGLQFHKGSTESRQTRMAYATMEVYNRLSPSEVEEVLSEVQDLVAKYVQYGEEGTLEGDGEALFDYIEARSGTSYTSTGLAAKSYVPDGKTLSELVTRLMDILKDGEY